jgi:hypothetical protein
MAPEIKARRSLPRIIPFAYMPPRFRLLVRRAIMGLVFLAGCIIGLAIAVLTGLVRLPWLK